MSPRSSYVSIGPSLFGRDLAEQVQADSKDEERVVPVIVEKCIDAVDTLGAFILLTIQYVSDDAHDACS